MLLSTTKKTILFFLCWHFFWRGVCQSEGWLINCTIVTVTATATSQVMHIVQYSVTLLVTTPDSHSIDYSPTCHKSSLSQQWNHLSICLQEHDALVSSPFPLHGRWSVQSVVVVRLCLCVHCICMSCATKKSRRSRRHCYVCVYVCMCVYTPSPSAHTRRPCTVYHCCYPTKQCTSSPWDNAACFCAVVLQTVHVGHQLPCAATDVVSGTSQSERRRLFRTVFRSGQMGSPCRRSSRIDVRCILLLPRRWNHCCKCRKSE